MLAVSPPPENTGSTALTRPPASLGPSNRPHDFLKTLFTIKRPSFVLANFFPKPLISALSSEPGLGTGTAPPEETWSALARALRTKLVAVNCVTSRRLAAAFSPIDSAVRTTSCCNSAAHCRFGKGSILRTSSFVQYRVSNNMMRVESRLGHIWDGQFS